MWPFSNSSGRFKFGGGIFGKICLIALVCIIGIIVLAMGVMPTNPNFCYFAVGAIVAIAGFAIYQIRATAREHPSLAAMDKLDWFARADLEFGSKQVSNPSKRQLVAGTTQTKLPEIDPSDHDVPSQREVIHE